MPEALRWFFMGATSVHLKTKYTEDDDDDDYNDNNEKRRKMHWID